MKTFVVLLAWSFTLSLTAADSLIRTNIDQDIPLAEAVRWANGQFHPNPPLTEAEVIAAVRAIKLEHSDISPQLLEIYQRVPQEQVLPKDMYFVQTTHLDTTAGEFQMDRINLVWRDPSIYYDIMIDGSGRHKLAGKIVANPTNRASHYVLPIRNRYISSTPPAGEKAAATPAKDNSTGSR